MTKSDNTGGTNQHEVIEEGMQGATGNVDANGMDKNMTEQEKQAKLEELGQNLNTQSQPE